MKITQVFKALREPSLTDHMASRDAFMYLEKTMRLLGWLAATKGSQYSYGRYFKLVRIITFLAIFYPCVGYIVTYTTEFHQFTISELFKSLQVAINTPCASSRSFFTFIHLWRLEILKGFLDKLDKSCISIEEKFKTHKRVKFCNIVYLLYFGIYTTFGNVQFLFTAPRGVLPWNLYIPFINWRNGYCSFWASALLEHFLMLTVLIFNQMNDACLVLFGTIIRLHLELLQERIQKLRSDPNQSEEQDFEDLIGCINDHRLITDACNIMRPYISVLIFIQFLVVGLLFGFCMIGIMFAEDLLTVISTLVYVVGLFCQTFPFCYTCTLISNDCDNLSFTLFHSNWIDASRRYKCTLLYFLHNAQQNVSFTAGSIFDICLNTNISLAKLAFSVVTFVKQTKMFDNLKNN